MAVATSSATIVDRRTIIVIIKTPMAGGKTSPLIRAGKQKAHMALAKRAFGGCERGAFGRWRRGCSVVGYEEPATRRAIANATAAAAPPMMRV